jgi:hypothetical protein
MNSNDLDRSITGNWGEDSVAPEFVKARELAEFELTQPIVIDVASQTGDRQIRATVKDIAVASGFVYVTAEEFEWPIVIPEEASVYFADPDEV